MTSVYGTARLVVALGSLLLLLPPETVSAQLVAAPLRPKHRPVPQGPDDGFHAEHVLVRFQAGTSAAEQQAAHAAAGALEVLATYDLVPGLVLSRVPTGTVLATITAYEGQASVLYATVDRIVHALDTVPDDTLFDDLWGLLNVGQTVFGDPGVAGADIRATKAWDLWTGDQGFRIAVVDTGVDYLHPALAANMWTNPGEIEGNGIDDDRNGWIDDIHGYDTLNDDGDPMDDDGHGTHVAGTIGAVGNDALGVVGVNWRCSLVALKFLDGDGNGTESGAIAALDYIVGNGILLANHSYGVQGEAPALLDAFVAASAAGQLHIAAAGNDNLDIDAMFYSPASFDLESLITVAATTNEDARAGFSNVGALSVELGAPGLTILSTWWPGGVYNSIAGTSMAAPHVTGVAGLVMSRYPAEPRSVIRDLLLSHARPVPALAGITVTGAVVNAWASLEDCNENGILDRHEGELVDCDGNGTPDLCDINDGALDCNGNGVPDACDIASGRSLDLDGDGVPDECVPSINLGLGAPDFALDGKLLFAAVETDGGSGDLNGDGDVFDYVAHAWDPADGSIANLGLAVDFFIAPNDPPAITSIAVSEDLLVFSVREEDHGDLNGDGDAIDPVVHVHRDGTTTNLELPSRFHFVTWGGRFVAFPVLEAEHGAQDLDGDGSGDDLVLFVHDADTGLTTNVMQDIVTSSGMGDTTWLVFRSVVGVETHLLAREVVLGLSFDLGVVPEAVADAPYMLATRSEASDAADWNADGDQLDAVLHVYTSFLTLTNQALAATGPTVEGTLGAFAVPEASQGGADLNGDGDDDDAVLHVLDLGSGVITNLGLASTWQRVDGDHVATLVSEAGQGEDLDGDGTLDAPHGVLHVYDRVSGQTTNLGLAPNSPQVVGPQDGWLAVIVFEGALAPPADLNDDGDLLDLVLQAVELASGTVTNLGLAVGLGGSPPSIDGGYLACVVSEPGMGAADLNGDGDAADWVAHVCDLAAGTTLNTQLAPGSIGPNSFERTWPRVRAGQVAFAVHESSQGGTDLNDDGVLGLVMHVVTMTP